MKMIYRTSKKIYESIQNGHENNPNNPPLGYKAILAEINRMVCPITPITRIIIEKGE